MGTNRSIYSSSLLQKIVAFPRLQLMSFHHHQSQGRETSFIVQCTRFRLILKFHIRHSKSKFNFDPFLKNGLEVFFAKVKNQIFDSCWELNSWFKESQVTKIKFLRLHHVTIFDFGKKSLYQLFTVVDTVNFN